MPIRAIPQTGDDDSVSVPWLLLHCLGFGACWGWVHVGFFSSVLLSDSGGAGLVSWLVNLVSNGLAMVAAGWLLKGSDWLDRRGPWYAAALVLCGTLATALLRWHLPFAAWLACGPAATGAGTALLLLAWARAYGVIDAGRAKRYALPGAMTAGVLIYLLVVSLTKPAAIVACAALPLLSVVCLKSTYRSEVGGGRGAAPAGSVPVDGAAFRRMLARFVVIVSVYCLPSGFMSGSTDSFTEPGTLSAGALMFGGIAVILIAVAVLSAVVMKPDNGDFAYRLIVPLMAAGLLLMPFVTGTASAAANIAIMGGYIILEMYAWSSLQEMARASGRPSTYVVGLGKPGMNLGLFVGCMLGTFASSRSTMLALGVCVAIVYAFILISALAPGRPRAALVPPVMAHGAPCAGEGGAGSTVPPPPSIDELRSEQCRGLAVAYGLSSREEDVLRMLLAGRSLDVIAETLGIAQSTVRSHRDHIYRKLGVHGRQELLDRAEASRG